MSDNHDKMDLQTPSPPASHSRPAVMTTPTSASTSTKPQAATPAMQSIQRNLPSPTKFLKTIITPQQTQKSTHRAKAYSHDSNTDASSNATEDTTPQQTQASRDKGKGRAYSQNDTSDQASNASEEITPADAETLSRIADLRNRDYMLMSDFSILRGEFRKAEFENNPNHRYSCEFRKSKLEDFHSQFFIDEELKKLERYLKTFRRDRAQNRLTPDQIHYSAIKYESSVISEMNAQFEEKKRKITNLRKTLEKLGTVGPKGYYAYNLDIQYQIIGNQAIPASAKSHRRKGVKVEPRSAKRKGDDSDDEIDTTPSHPSKRGKKDDASMHHKPRPPPQSLGALFPYLENKGLATNGAAPSVAQPNFLGSRPRISRPQGQRSLAPTFHDASDEMVGVIHTQETVKKETDATLVEKLALQIEDLQKQLADANKAKDPLR